MAADSRWSIISDHDSEPQLPVVEPFAAGIARFRLEFSDPRWEQRQWPGRRRRQWRRRREQQQQRWWRRLLSSDPAPSPPPSPSPPSPPHQPVGFAALDAVQLAQLFDAQQPGQRPVSSALPPPFVPPWTQEQTPLCGQEHALAQPP